MKVWESLLRKVREVVISDDRSFRWQESRE